MLNRFFSVILASCFLSVTAFADTQFNRVSEIFIDGKDPVVWIQAELDSKESKRLYNKIPKSVTKQHYLNLKEFRSSDDIFRLSCSHPDKSPRYECSLGINLSVAKIMEKLSPNQVELEGTQLKLKLSVYDSAEFHKFMTSYTRTPKSFSFKTVDDRVSMQCERLSEKPRKFYGCSVVFDLYE